MRLLALIQAVDDKHCSLNCQLLNLGRCTARGYGEKQIEDLQRNKDRTNFLRIRISTNPLRLSRKSPVFPIPRIFTEDGDPISQSQFLEYLLHAGRGVARG